MSRDTNIEIRNIYLRLLSSAQDGDYDRNGALLPDAQRDYERSHIVVKLHFALHDIFLHRHPRTNHRPYKSEVEALDIAHEVLWPDGESSLTDAEKAALINSLSFIAGAHFDHDPPGPPSAEHAAPFANRSLAGY